MKNEPYLDTDIRNRSVNFKVTTLVVQKIAFDMETNQEGKAEKFLKDFGKKLDGFLVEVKDASTRVEADMHKKYEELKIAAEKIKKEAESKERWKEVEASLKKAGTELENAFKSAFKKKEDKG
jgi:hypothetical protein